MSDLAAAASDYATFVLPGQGSWLPEILCQALSLSI